MLSKRIRNSRQMWVLLKIVENPWKFLNNWVSIMAGQNDPSAIEDKTEKIAWRPFHVKREMAR